MNKVHEILLLAAVPGLMICIVPVTGMEFRLSWQLAAIWLGGLAFTAVLSSWWWKGFFLLALARTATILPPAYDAYLGLLMIALFLAAAEGFTRIDPDRTMDGMCLAAIMLLLWMSLQQGGWAKTWFSPERIAGPFNPVSGGVFLALCLPACMREDRLLLIPCIVWGIMMTGSSTAFLAAVAGTLCFIFRRYRDQGFLKRFTARSGFAVLLVLIALTGIWFSQVRSFNSMIQGERWTAWKHAAWSLRSEALGRGIGSWQTIFPLLASGDQSLGDVRNEGRSLVMNSVFTEAHNEYVQTAFELGIPALLLIAAFMAAMAWGILRGTVAVHVAMGMTILCATCFGWHVFHVGPTALLGCAWLGLSEGQRREDR